MRNKRLVIDILMAVLLPFLMVYSLIGETLHELAGIAMFVLVMIHNWLNRKWWLNIFKGRYDGLRVFRTIINVLLIVGMVMQPVSGILISRHILSQLTIYGASGLMRDIHRCLGYWCLVLTGLHMGLHVKEMTLPLTRKLSGKAMMVLKVLTGAVALYGLYAFHNHEILDHLLLRSAFSFFDDSLPFILPVLDYLAMLVSFTVVGALVRQLLNRK